jgi:uncharacterized protein (DUF1684 family)
MFKNKIVVAVIVLGLIAVFVYNFSGSPDFETTTKAAFEKYKSNLLEMEGSPVKEKNLNGFDFFEPNKSWLINATFTKNDSLASFDMLMTDSTYSPSKLYGMASFKISDRKISLLIFEEENNYLLPFTDLTNSKTTYGGGRYINVPKEALSENKIIIDFNLARNYYCAYNEQFVCPIPPKENHILLEVNAGEKNYKP